MKSITFLLGVFFSMHVLAFDSESIPVQHIEQYTRTQQNAMRLTLNFAQPFIVTPELLQKIEGIKVHHIDLVYTSYKESEDFDQLALNEKRIKELEMVLPQLFEDEPSWTYIEQTGAKNRSEAKNYFHGFVIHFGNQTSYSELRTFFEEAELSKEFTPYTISNEEETTITVESGTQLHIPKNAVRTKDGLKVEGEYTLNYREFRNQSDIVFSGIPMQYKESDEKFNFVSVGMYELRGEQNGVELELQAPITVDFIATEVAENVDFYALNDETETWAKIKPIEFVKPLAPSVPKAKNWFWTASQFNEDILIKFKPQDYAGVLDTIMQDEYWSDIDIKEQPKLNGFAVHQENYHDFLDFLMKCVRPPVPQMTIGSMGELVFENATVSRYRTTPTLLSGLKPPGFGVFNCDSKSRFEKQVELNPTYVDENSTLEIECQLTSCLIDRNINGAISYHPNSVVCDAKGDNILLLFTSDERIFLYEEFDFDPNSEVKVYTDELQMTEITALVRKPKDLKKFLKL